MNRRRTTVSVIALAALMTGCGSSSSTTDADVMFAQMMIPHHEQAIELADLALDPAAGSSADVQQLAREIKAAQDPEIALMTEWLAEGGHSLSTDDDVDHSSMMKGMLTLEELDALRELTGSEFDVVWIDAMIAHHEGAIDMARTVLTNGKDADIAALADSIIRSQGAEIEILQSLTS